MKNYLDFEKKIRELDLQINKLEECKKSEQEGYSRQIRDLKIEREGEIKKIYSQLSAWQTVQVARHPDRPKFQDYLEGMIDDFSEMHGDRCFGDDRTIITGLGKIGRERVMIIGQNKGRETKEKIKSNFGYANPEGYRKALLKMKFAEKYNIPIITFIDTPGANPGIGAEERGQSSAIAINLREMSRLKSPIISVVIGEGGSGGALGIGVADKIAMLEYAYYSVIAPEGCAAILWKDRKYAEKAAEALKLTSKEIYKLNLIDEIISEPLGGAHRGPYDTFQEVKKYIENTIRGLKKIPLEELLNQRYKKLRNGGNPPGWA